ncbi:unnamed protein product, partial [Cyprideis torosa]
MGFSRVLFLIGSFLVAHLPSTIAVGCVGDGGRVVQVQQEGYGLVGELFYNTTFNQSIEFYQFEFDDQTLDVDEYIEISMVDDANTTTVSFKLLKDLNDSFAETSNQQSYLLRVNCSLLSSDEDLTQLSLLVNDANDNPPVWETEDVIQANITDNVPLRTDLSFFDDQLLELIASDEDGGEENYKIMFECTSTNSVIQCSHVAELGQKKYRPILVLGKELDQGVDQLEVTVTAKNL